ncbi:hypothetical protein [Hyphomonas sp.]|uniref:hypothetical protein n=1 Tax=Hyphomonas sp. TaxID=87 RepID=UPI003529BCB4
MREEETFQDLTSLFAAEDRALEAKPFVDEVMGKVRRRALMRRAVLLAVGGVGAIVAALQMPGLLGDWAALDNTVVNSIASAQQQADLLASSNPLWLGIAAVVGLCVAAVATMERA